MTWIWLTHFEKRGLLGLGVEGVEVSTRKETHSYVSSVILCAMADFHEPPPLCSPNNMLSAESRRKRIIRGGTYLTRKWIMEMIGLLISGRGQTWAHWTMEQDHSNLNTPKVCKGCPKKNKLSFFNDMWRDQLVIFGYLEQVSLQSSSLINDRNSGPMKYELFDKTIRNPLNSVSF